MKRLLTAALLMLVCLVAGAQVKQYVIFQLSPRNATVVFDGETLKNDRGYCYKLVDLGLHTYSVSAAGYSTEEGQVLVDNVENKMLLKVSLLDCEDFGSLDIITEPTLSEVEIDGFYMGVTPLLLENLRTGRHSLRLLQDGFEPVVQDVVVLKDSVVTVCVKIQ